MALCNTRLRYCGFIMRSCGVKTAAVIAVLELLDTITGTVCIQKALYKFLIVILCIYANILN